MNNEDTFLARDLVHTVIEFIDNGKVDSLVEDEMTNYFRMCRQIEIYYEKFALNGMYIRVKPGTGCVDFSEMPDDTASDYDLSRLADKLFELFCRPSVPPTLLARATCAYRMEIGNDRLGQCIQNFARLKQVFNLSQICERTGNQSFILEAAYFVECYLTISSRHNGMAEVDMLLRTLIIENECAETVVGIFAVEYDIDRKLLNEIKTILLKHLKNKYQTSPSESMWITILKSQNLIPAVNSFEPLHELIFQIIKDITAIILSLQPYGKESSSQFKKYKYDDLVNLMIRLYRNPKSMQKSMNFMFSMCQTDALVWANIMSACHNNPVVEEEFPAIL